MKKTMTSFLIAICSVVFLCACGQTSTAPTWQEQYDLGVRYLSEGNYEEAIIAFTAVIEIDPKNIDAYLGRANAYIGSGETEENLASALADYQSVLEIDDTRADAYLGMADVYIRQGEYEKAQDILEQGFEKAGDQSISDKLVEIKAGTITDSSGKTRRKSGYDAAGTLVWYHTYTYDTQGRMSAVTSYGAEGGQTGHVDIIYDESGRYLNSWHWGEGGAVGRIDNEYDSNGNIVKETCYELDGSISYYDICEYDDHGNMIKRKYYGADNTLSNYDVYSYDENNRAIRQDCFSADGTLQDYFTSTYHDNGERDMYSRFDADGALTWYWVDQYDKEWNYIGWKEYDAEGNLMGSEVTE